MKSFSPRRVVAMARKEFRHILRDGQTLAIILVLPVFMMFLYGYALNLDPSEIAVIVEDAEGSRESRFVISAIDASDMFAVVGTRNAAAHPEALFRGQDVRAVFRIPAGFTHSLRSAGSPARVQVLIDGADPNLATLIRNAAAPLVRGASLEILGISPPSLIAPLSVILYNPEQKSSLYFVPGLMAVILLLISALLTSVTLVREKESGTLEQLFITPLHPFEILTGKMLPYILLAAVDGVLVMAVGYAAFDLRVKGSLLFLSFASLIYIFAGLSLGLLISTVAKRQQHAMMLALGATLMPSVILSGFIFPIAGMPAFLQALSHIIPATWFLEIVRGVVLKGTGLAELGLQVLALSVEGFLLLGLALLKFRSKL